jgi:predicted 3-demethylubiquinone-9 3-methyltransferase (glyoxalase superfamily)
MVVCDGQTEVDKLWSKLIGDGGKESACGWLKDKYGLSWQITPKRLLELIGDKDSAKASRAMNAMMQMVKLDIATIEAAAKG